ncbi:hypothetical protein MTBBW1_630014 [Desulfamplus magnetovallimortis]|uniref:Uncharacterized protein n=1 Tax=Desulfamplus magnetovallimortis TaxID=1246637 RepID=A0A1W1HIQ4_9BACT|nr:hypothetical protein MTBBW1_630014 [Desulfamplus magnetovallimortis]
MVAKVACFISQFTLSGEKTLCGGNLSQKSVKYFWVQMKDADKATVLFFRVDHGQGYE